MAFNAEGFQAMAARLQDALEDFFPGVLEIDGVEYGVACVGGRIDSQMVVGGLEEEMGQGVRLRKSLYPQRPPLGKSVVLNGQRARISEVSDRAAAESWSLRVVLPR
jgi:hypothetical protein